MMLKQNPRFQNLRKLLNLYKVSGITGFVILQPGPSDISISVVSVSTNNYLPDFSSPGNFRILARERFTLQNVRSAGFTNELQSFLTRYNAQGYYSLLLIDDYKYHLLTIPEDAEEDDIWLAENYTKFLPPTVDLGDFLFIFEDLHHGENGRLVELIMIRRNYFEEWIRTFEQLNLKLLGAIPSLYFFRTVFNNQSNTPALLIALQDQRLQYLFRSEGKAIRNEFHLEQALPALLPALGPEIPGRIRDIRQSLAGTDDLSQTDSITVALIAPAHVSVPLTEALRNEFPNLSVIQMPPTAANESTDNTCIMPLWDFTNADDSGINIYTTETQVLNRGELEKQFTYRLFLAMGIAVFALLFVLNMLFYIFSALNQSASEQMTEIEEMNRLINIQKKDVKFIQLEISSLQNLQYHSKDISGIMKTMSRTINASCILTDLKIHHNKERDYSVAIQGNALTQGSIARFMQDMEQQPEIKSVKLHQSAKLDEAMYQKLVDQFPETEFPDNLYSFNITCTYVSTAH